jgi:2-polyprenyl-3-methyl-5-hydroxy-6-metoxy-1,4-benzoquinol methylase
MNSPREVTPQELCHDRLGDRFADALSEYDTRRRVEILVDEFLTDEMIVGKSVLDVGCGLGFFSERLVRRGANVLACDIGPQLVEKTKARAGCEAVVADALNLTGEFGEQRFDVVVSSECIEHTPDPPRAVQEMVMVLKDGGFLSLSTPNVLWYPVVRLATMMRLRPFDGHERFSSWRSLRGTLEQCGAEVTRDFGLHLFPFQFGLHRLSTALDTHVQVLRGLMINLCILARKTR